MNEQFSYHELMSAIRQSKKNTSPGEDRIPFEFLKEMPKGSQHVVLKLYNKIWDTGNVPTQWKHAIVLPILKAGKDPHAPSSYRPISLTSTLCKVMEKLIANRLMWFLEKNNKLSNVQTGFRKNRSTVDQIVWLQDAINKYIRNQGHTLGVFLDFKNAFDKIVAKWFIEQT